MKGGISRYRGKEFFLLLIVIVGTSFLIWGWDRTPFITTFPSTDDQLQFSQETPLATKEVSISKKDVLEENEVKGDLNVEETNPTVTTTVDVKDNEIVNLENAGNVESSKEEKDKQTIGEKDLKHNKDAKEEEDKQTIGEKDLKHNEDAKEEEDKQTIGEKDLKRNEETVDLAPPVNPVTKSSSVVPPRDEKNQTVLVNSQTCNYAKGKWVIDDRGPVYSGFECKQWLAQMWACRLMQRTDFSFEKLRWQPINCEMERFESAKFFERMRDKTLAFVGDSLGRQQFQSLMCMVTAGKETPGVVDVGSEFGLTVPQGGSRPNGWAYRFPSSNTTILYYWSSCLCDLDPVDPKNPDTEYAMHLDRPPAFLRRFLHKIDVLVLNTGHHWNRGKIQANRWVMYVGGKPNTNKKLLKIGDAKNFTIHSVIGWVNKQLPKNPGLKAFYRSISPRHFVNGEWNTGGSCNNTIPMSVGKEILRDESSDYSAGNAVKGTGVRLLDVTALSQVRDEGHISRYSLTASPGVHDCLHWCLPGVPDTWNEILFAQISDMSTS